MAVRRWGSHCAVQHPGGLVASVLGLPLWATPYTGILLGLCPVHSRGPGLVRAGAAPHPAQARCLVALFHSTHLRAWAGPASGRTAPKFPIPIALPDTPLPSADRGHTRSHTRGATPSTEPPTCPGQPTPIQLHFQMPPDPRSHSFTGAARGR